MSGIHKIIYADGRSIEHNPLDEREIEKKNRIKDKTTPYKVERTGLRKENGFWSSCYYYDSVEVSGSKFRNILRQNQEQHDLYSRGHG